MVLRNRVRGSPNAVESRALKSGVSGKLFVVYIYARLSTRFASSVREDKPIEPRTDNGITRRRSDVVTLLIALARRLGECEERERVIALYLYV